MFRQNQDTRQETLWMSSGGVVAGIHFVMPKCSRRVEIYNNNEAMAD